jgi:HSP20 family protein
MSMIRYGHPMLALHRQLNQMFDEFDSDLFGHLEELGEGLFAPAVDVREDDAAYTVWLEVPGVRREALDISLQNNVLTIKGTKEQAAVEGRYRRVERSYGSFVRSLSLPRNVDENGVVANLENGVLEVRLPKREEARARQIAVSATVNAQSAETPDAKPENSQPEQQSATQGDSVSQDLPETAAGANSDDAPAGHPS